MMKIASSICDAGPPGLTIGGAAVWIPDCGGGIGSALSPGVIAASGGIGKRSSWAASGIPISGRAGAVRDGRLIFGFGPSWGGAGIGGAGIGEGAPGT